MKNLRVPVLLFLAAAFAIAASPGRATAPAAFTDWPAGTSPAEVGKRIAENYAARSFEWQTNPKRKFVIYPEICGWYGALEVAKLTGNAELQQRLVKKYDVLLAPGSEGKISPQGHVDYRIFGAAPLEIYLLTKDKAFFERGLPYADAQWATTTPDGITTEARYWVDDLFMSTILQVQAFRATGDRKYLDRSAQMMAAYLDKLAQPNGLYFHAPDSPFFWGRGNGWVAAGMTELLRELPADHPRCARILDGYHKMMAALLAMQGADGMWRQLLDKPEAWPESSCSAMFAYAFVSGVKHGWLDEKTYAPAARKAWLALVGYLDTDANVREVCIGTNKSHQETKTDEYKLQYDFYMARPRRSGDLHGQSPMMWTAAAFLR